MKDFFIIEKTKIKLDLSILNMNTFQVKSSPYNYTVFFESKAALRKRLLRYKKLNSKKHFIYADEKVNELYGSSLWEQQRVHNFKATEKSKTINTALKIVDHLQANNYTKKETLVTIGGGITQDVSAFARAIFKRGIDWSFIPTTLLAMADSCIGSKSAINYGTTKNLVGLFSAPREAVICEDFLKSLDPRDILSGYGEIIKLCIVGGETTLNYFRNYIELQNGNPLKNINKLIRLALLVKKSVIEIDEFEFNIRRALNYGHTIGHAIEPLVKYKIPHGVAVSIGMISENIIACEAGRLPVADCKMINNIIIKFIDNESLKLLKSVPVDSVIDNMRKDKKALRNNILIAVPFKVGYFDMLQVNIGPEFTVLLHNILTNISNRKIN